MTKDELRTLFRKLRATLSEKRRRAASEKACHELLESLQPFDFVVSFMSTENEIDLLSLNAQLAKEGRLVLTRDQRLFHVTDLKRLEKRGSLLEPPLTCPEIAIDKAACFLVPALAFHMSGHRLGSGGGYYDRLLARAAAPIWGVGFKEQVALDLPYEKHDIAMEDIFLF